MVQRCSSACALLRLLSLIAAALANTTAVGSNNISYFTLLLTLLQLLITAGADTIATTAAAAEEMLDKYVGLRGRQLLQMCHTVFDALPLCALIQEKIFVVHGGLFPHDGVTFDHIRGMSRKREPPIHRPVACMKSCIHVMYKRSLQRSAVALLTNTSLLLLCCPTHAGCDA
eukprot:7888-Heterococcus_DN1.PRE.1